MSIMNIADIVFEQTHDFKFIIRKSKVSNVGHTCSSGVVEDAFNSWVYRVLIIDSENNILSDNKVERKGIAKILDR